MRNTRTLTRRAAVSAACAVAALVLAACGGGGDSSGSGSGPTAAHGSTSASAGAHNAQDVSFAQGMIPHHRQALEMARLAAGRASSARVEDLAARIEKAQEPEIRTMSGWLTSWGEDVPGSSGSDAESMPGMDHSGSGMPGMMAASDMAALGKASGKDFDARFLAMMVDHHKGAVDMATAEKKKGAYAPATSLADDIVAAQTAEITEMNELLGNG
ncbi:uncharacterized protein (DUF305 family) [Streptomyces achromogenes]|uniref:Uncharacterized protein (DUF305 family) n=1 Tax=Streptomyces achromogenes TaxID=67255 RepID=A0ABU0QF43_STRAH|nr:DUF305 domain-containing protein [Streptomyces achromogenes]MDQ0688363.1 uncharacterized protein (DUF305 family) [Streptomyces achromogenes]MDQ0835557.1 uncharacterized protein (DUF305 family) [Streptomyces achromogenes]